MRVIRNGAPPPPPAWPSLPPHLKVDVLGVLRCDWSEVASLIGVAVTPVVGFLGNLSREQIHPNPDEVREVLLFDDTPRPCLTLPLCPF